jgi:hypothetical protein
MSLVYGVQLRYVLPWGMVYKLHTLRIFLTCYAP